MIRHTALALSAIPTLTMADPICDGRYDDAVTILDSAYGKYGTLYSGGNHRHVRDNVGATLDVWRLLQGYGDLNLRRADQLHYGGAEDPLSEDYQLLDLHALLSARLDLITNPDTTDLSDEDAYIIATTADLITSPGPHPDWWLTDEVIDITDVEDRTRTLARTEPLIDWLQITLAASYAPWANGWHLSGPLLWGEERQTYERITQHAQSRANATRRAIWDVATAISDGNRIGNAAALAEDARAGLLDCTASPADYATHAVLRLEALRLGASPREDDADLLPINMRVVAFENLTHQTLVAMPRDGSDRPFPLHLDSLIPSIETQSWFNVAQSYRANSIDALIEIHGATPLHPYTYRMLNALSVDDLRHFANDPARLPDDRRVILTSAFARLYALGRDADAEAMIPALQNLYPDQAAAIGTIAGRLWPREVKLAMILLELPHASTWLRPPADTSGWHPDIALILRQRGDQNMDLPAEMRSGQHLQRDLETYLRLPSRWGAFYGMRGAALGYIDRAHDRSLRPAFRFSFPMIIPNAPGDRIMPFHDLIAWQELVHFGPRTGLSRRISETLVLWADARTDTWFERITAPQDEMAEALRQIVLLARTNDIGALDGKPLARHAFEIMHYRLYDSPATAETSVWHACDRRCER